MELLQLDLYQQEIESGDIDLSSRVRNRLEDIFGESVLKAAESQVNLNGAGSRLIGLHGLLERYGNAISDSGVRAITTYIEHIMDLSDSGIDIDLSIPPKKIVCNHDELFLGAIDILKIFSNCGGKISKLSKFFLRIKILYFLYNFSYYLFSRNRSRFSFMIPYINC